jgi:tetratricopeptide (TPR) repeat protein
MSGRKFKTTIVLAGLLAALFFANAALAQNSTPNTTGAIFDPTRFGTVLVYLKTEDGNPIPLKATPVVRIRPSVGGSPLQIAPTWTGEVWLFSGVGIDSSYQIMVTAEGYLPAVQTVEMPGTANASASVIVVMQALNQELAFHPPTGQFALAPKAAKEVQNALHDLQYGRVTSGEKHAESAVQIAPDNPYTQYVMGLTFLLTNRINDAKPYLEKSVSIDSSEAPALLALGRARLHLGDPAGAATVLSRAVQLDPSSWRAEWLLAASYLNIKKYQEAIDHGNQALKIGKQRAGQVKLVIGQAEAALGNRTAGAEMLEAFANEYPNDPNIAAVRGLIQQLREPAKVASLPTEMMVSAEPPVEVPPRPDWAPPDIDAINPFAVTSAACSLPQILSAAGKNADQFVANLEKFTATEDFQEIEIKHGGELQKFSQNSFEYLVFVERVSSGSFDVSEFRTKDSVRVQLPGRVEDNGVAALALAFHPIIQPDLDWKCEGLGTWDNQPAWIIHFQQKPKAPNVLSWFSSPGHSYALPLKGRAWVSQASSDVLHLDTDLVNEIQPIDLKRQHFSIDYAAVPFRGRQQQLWLPVNVDSYIQYRGHFLHYYHHFSDYKLFSVDTTQKISTPKEAQDPDQPQKK